MSSHAFRPHGLIRSPLEEVLYQRAHIANVYTRMADPEEHESSALMEVILRSNIFTDRETFMVISQQRPAPDSDRRCNIVVSYLERGCLKIRPLCFVECTRTRTTQQLSLTALERQAQEYCMLYLESEQDMEFVFAATMAGAHVRLWKCSRRGRMLPFWGPSSDGDWSEYKDVGDDNAGQEVEHCFGQMKTLSPPLHAGQDSETQGSANTIAPSCEASTSDH